MALTRKISKDEELLLHNLEVDEDIYSHMDYTFSKEDNTSCKSNCKTEISFYTPSETTSFTDLNTSNMTFAPSVSSKHIKKIAMKS